MTTIWCWTMTRQSVVLFLVQWCPWSITPNNQKLLLWLRNISKLKTLVSKAEFELIIFAFIYSRIHYCNNLCTCLNKKELGRLQDVQNSARLLTRTSKEHTSLHWLPVCFRINFKILVRTFRGLNRQAPSYISELLQFHNPSCSLRSSGHQAACGFLNLNLRNRSFQTVAPRLWHALPLPLCCLNYVDSLKKQLKTVCFETGFQFNMGFYVSSLYFYVFWFYCFLF